MVVVEKEWVQYKVPRILQHHILASLWTFLGLTIPLPLLFHAQFIKYIVMPIAGIYLK